MSKNNLPNFLIVGTAKGGTTSLHKYLELNDSIYMSKIKEPKYFSFLANKSKFNGPGDRAVLKNVIKSYDSYLKLFKAGKLNDIMGESSADYLYYYNEVGPLIKKYLNNPKIIILLRNPIDRAFSAYTHLIRDNRETTYFEKGLKLEKYRIEKGFEFIWHFKQVGRYYKQVDYYLKNFTNVKIILFEDLKSDSQKVVNETCEFLGVHTVKINSNKIYNKSGIPKKNWQTYLYNNLVISDNTINKTIKKLLPESTIRLIGGKLTEKLFVNNLEKPQMKPETRKMLINYYRKDILKLQELINRDLTSWIKYDDDEKQL